MLLYCISFELAIQTRTISKKQKNTFAKLHNFAFSCLCCLFDFNRTQPYTAATCNFKMAIEMHNAINNPFTFSHAVPCSEHNSIAPFAFADGCMRFMRIAPGRASVNKSFKLSRDIRLIERDNRNDHICPFILLHDDINIIVLNTLCCV